MTISATINDLVHTGEKISENRSERLQSRLDAMYLGGGMAADDYEIYCDKLESITEYE